jgi:hypothetical protein
MKPLRWNLGKNLKLKLERGIGFETIAAAIERNAFTIKEAKSKNHPGQKCFIVRASRKTWVVPYKEHRGSYYLYTIFEMD